MPLEHHWERQNTPIRALPMRDMRVFIGGAALAAALALVVVFAAVVQSKPAAPHPGCRIVVVATSTGGASVERCPAARR